MSTRSVIAREIDATKGKFLGVYHHWDGYPSGLGAQLFELYQKQFDKDSSAMLKFLIDDHPAGWSTINGADFSLPPGPRPDSNQESCDVCGRKVWEHYRRYYRDKAIPAEFANAPTTTALLTDHAPKVSDKPHGPECYTDAPNPITEKNASAVGCEWAYVFAKDKPAMYVLSSYASNGRKMIGMFGCGDPKAKWKCVAEVDLNGQEPDWKRIGD